MFPETFSYSATQISNWKSQTVLVMTRSNSRTTNNVRNGWSVIIGCPHYISYKKCYKLVGKLLEVINILVAGQVR